MTPEIPLAQKTIDRYAQLLWNEMHGKKLSPTDKRFAINVETDYPKWTRDMYLIHKQRISRKAS